MLNVNCRFTITIEKRRTIANSLVQKNHIVGNHIHTYLCILKKSLTNLKLSIMKASKRFYDILVKKWGTKVQTLIFKGFPYIILFFP